MVAFKSRTGGSNGAGILRFVERDKKNLVATHKGISLVTIVSDSFKSAETTAKWEMELSDIAQGKSSKEEFLEEIENEIKEVVLTYRK